ncbi:MAG: hypothetical protein IH927_07230, partial [Proteobacteria bacterium]|nr:hypothetical protein [Pseudomonadota bacterium]
MAGSCSTSKPWRSAASKKASGAGRTCTRTRLKPVSRMSSTPRPDISNAGQRQGEDLTSSLQPISELVTWNKLTGRERDVLNGIARGQSNREIAVSLGIGLGTVKAHVKRMFLKLGVHDRVLA